MRGADCQVVHLDRTTSLEQQLVRLPAGAHACLIYTTPAERLRAVVPFFREGWRRREQCLYVADASKAANALVELEASGPAAQAAIDSGGLRLLAAREAYLRDGRFDPDAMIGFLLASAKSTRAAGYAGLRVAGVPISAGDGEHRHLDGVVWVHSAAPRTFTDDELLLVETVACLLAQAMARSRAEAELHTFLDNIPDLIARFDRDLRYVYVNPAVERLTGLPASRLIGKSSREAGLPEALAPAWELLLRQAWRSGREQLTEFAIPTPSGDRHFETRILPEFSPAPGPGPEGTVQSLLSISRDVTEQRQAEPERAALYREVVAQQARLTELVSRLDRDRARDLQRTAHAIQAEHLTPRERDVLRLLARGWSNREIAAELRLASGTVKDHVASILTKLDASDRTQAAARAVDLGIAQSD